MEGTTDMLRQRAFIVPTACTPGRFMLEMHLMARVHPLVVRMMDDASVHSRSVKERG